MHSIRELTYFIFFVLFILVSVQNVIGQNDNRFSNHIIVIGIDGLTSDGIHNANTPTIDSLLLHAAYTFSCQAVLPTSSSPNWASMIMGASPIKHGVTSNDWEPDDPNIDLECTGRDGKGRNSQMWPTIFGELRRQDPLSKIACFNNWWGFDRLIEKGILTKHRRSGLLSSAFNKGHFNVTRKASRYFKKKSPNLMFVHLDHVDHAGHEFGYGTHQYYDAVHEADNLIKRLIHGIERSGKANKTHILITSDHGGIGTGHGDDSPEERLIPWILTGPNIKAGELGINVNTFDTAATLAYILTIDKPECWEGVPVLEAFLY